MSKQRGLGRGLESLIRSQNTYEDGELRQIKIDQIMPNSYQPRRSFDEESLTELAASIKENGILEPLLVRRISLGYELVAGERRLRAAKIAGLSEVPCILRELNDQQTATIALIENLQRADLNPIEEAHAFRRMLDEFNLTQEELAVKVGRSRSHLANIIRLLQLPIRVQQRLLSGELEMGHARAILSLEPEQQVFLVDKIIADQLNVRQAEQLVKQFKAMDKPKPRKKQQEAQMQYWESRLKQHLQTQVQIRKSGKKGSIEISFFDANDLERLLEALMGVLD